MHQILIHLNAVHFSVNKVDIDGENEEEKGEL